MASGKALNAANLESLGAPCLAALLLEISTGNAAARRRLRLELAGSTGTAEVARQVTKRLASLASAKGFIDWRRTRLLVTELEAQRRAILDLVAPADPCEAFELAWRLVAAAQPVLSRCNDASGRLAAVFGQAVADLGPLAQAAHPDPEALARRAFEALRTDRHGIWEALVPTLAPHLGPQGLEALRSLMQGWHDEPAAILPERERKVIAWTATGRLYADEVETRRRRSTAGAWLRRIADAAGDVDGYAAQLDPAARRVPAVAAGLARRLVKAGRAQDAWDALVAARPGSHDPGAAEWEEARADTLDALGRPDEAQASRWQRFAATLDAHPLRALLRRLPDFEDFDAEQRALAHALAHRDLHPALAFLVAWPDLPRAARLVLDRAAELDGGRHELLEPAADALGARHPLAATLLRRAMIGATLAGSRSARYRHAARHLHDCAALAQGMADFGGAPDHEAYERALRNAHGRKAAFWGEVKASGRE